ncbi:hypothetical protein VULLAG_LOCUS16501 [Vulpes lagopus]
MGGGPRQPAGGGDGDRWTAQDAAAAAAAAATGSDGKGGGALPGRSAPGGAATGVATSSRRDRLRCPQADLLRHAFP